MLIIYSYILFFKFFFVEFAATYNPLRPRITTTIKLSRGKHIYESSTDDESDNDDKASSTSSSNPDESSDMESSHEEYVHHSATKVRSKRTTKISKLPPRKRLRKRREARNDKVRRPCRGKQIYESSTEESDSDDRSSSDANSSRCKAKKNAKLIYN